MRLILDTVGKLDWPRDRQGRPIYPEGFEALAKKMGRPLHPPGRDVRCIVSVGMLTEGWDCNNVTYIVGLRPFMSQLLCEQVVGRGLRRSNYDVSENGKLSEEVAKIFGVPFEVIPFKANPAGTPPPRVKRYRVHAIPEKADFEITFPRIEGYRQSIRNRVSVGWPAVATVRLDPTHIPPEVQVKGLLPSNTGRPTLSGPGALVDVTLNPFRVGRRMQELVFQMARDLTRHYAERPRPAPRFPSTCCFRRWRGLSSDTFARRSFRSHRPSASTSSSRRTMGSSSSAWSRQSRPDTAKGEAPKLPVLEKNRGAGSTGEVDFWTSREVREVAKCHLNYVVADTQQWEQSAAYRIDNHPAVASFVKNAGLGFAIPYFHNGWPHDYEPDFLIKLAGEPQRYLILKVKGYDPVAEVKAQAANRWVAAVNADGRHGVWSYVVVRRIADVDSAVISALSKLNGLSPPDTRQRIASSPSQRLPVAHAVVSCCARSDLPVPPSP